jgi:hypothetical protein
MDYTSLITSQHANKPKFAATVALLANSVGTIGDAAQSLITLFDLDSAVGEQLDQIGVWVGVSRRLSVPITGLFFSWDTTGLGWDEGQWRGPNDATSQLAELDDASYRQLLKVIILANHWDGTMVQYQKILQAFLPNSSIFAVDNQNMTMSIYVSGPPLTALQQAVVNGPLTNIKPAGVGLLTLTELDFGFSEAGFSSVGFGQGIFGL